MVVHNNILAGASGATSGAAADYEISRSLRFNSGDSSYLSRTPSSAGNSNTWTWSGWVKRSGLGAHTDFFSAIQSGGNATIIQFDNNDKLDFENFVGSSDKGRKITTQVFRDPSAWYHIVVVYDSGNSTADDRIILYVNGTRITSFSTSTNPDSGQNSIVNSTYPHYLGSDKGFNNHYFDGYLANVHFIDGQALAPTDFGRFDSNNVWQPKEYSGTYSPIVDQSQTWSSNTYFNNNGNGYNGSNTITKLFDGVSSSVSADGVLPAGSGDFTLDFGTTFSSASTVTFDLEGGGNSLKVNGSFVTLPGGSRTTVTYNVSGLSTIQWYHGAGSNYCFLLSIKVDGKELVDSGVTVTNNGFHLDFSDNSSNAALGNDKAGSNNWTPNNLIAIAGLETANQGMDVVTWIGNGSSQSISSLAFQPDFVWIKRRDATARNMVFNSIAGATKGLHTDSTGAEFTDSATLTGFTSNGFSVGSHALANANSGTYVAWAWKAGGAASSNTDGTITSSVSANSTYGFSIATYTGTGSNATVGHGLSSAPKWIIVKDRSQATGWSVYHSTIGTSSSNYIELQDTAGSSQDNTAFQNTAPTNSVFSIGTKAAVNTSGDNFVAYCWSEISGFSKFSSYTGSGSSGNAVTTGFKPRFVIVKRTTNISGSHMGWVMIDSERGHNKRLSAQSSAKENDGPINAASSPNDDITFQDDGFTLASGGSATNGNGETYIYAAFADKPPSEIIDSLIDTPTNYDADSGNNGGNYATMSPVGRTKTAYFTENGNLVCGNSSVPSGSSGSRGYIPSTIGFKSGKWYCEVQTTAASDGDVDFAVGIWPQNSTGYYSTGGSVTVRPTGHMYSPAGLHQSWGSTWTDNDIIGIAVDMDSSTKTIEFFKNGTSMASATTIADKEYFFGYGSDGGGGSRTYKATWNFGQRPFAYTPPTGHLSLCTQNLTDPTIADGSTAFDTSLYTGTGSSRSITGLNYSPDFVWIKQRDSSSNYHNLFDIVRGATKALYSNDTAAEATNANTLSAFNSDGFTVGTDGAVNGNSGSYVAWAWDAGALATNSAYNQSRTWSDNATGGRSDEPIEDLFNGDTSTFAQNTSGNTNPNNIVVTFSPGLAYTTSVEVYPQNASSCAINNGSQTSTTNNQWNTMASGSGTLTELDFQRNATNGCSVAAIRVDGKILVNPGIIPAGSISSGVPSIASTVRANPSAGFSIVSATAPSSNTSFTLGHGLNATPSFIIFRQRTASNWAVYHSGIASAETKYLHLNSANAVGTATTWNNTAPTSNVFSSTMSGNWDLNVGLIAYCFAPVEGYSAFGSYTGNGSADGPFLYTGFKPRWVMIKATSFSEHWYIYDTKRNTFNVNQYPLLANSSNGGLTYEGTADGGQAIDMLSNGFKIRGAWLTNNSSQNYIYAAFAENPFSLNGGLAR